MKSIVVGGGVIGLSLAFELVTRGHQVALLEKDQFGRKSSWAGAGILTPANRTTAIHPTEHLEALSHEVHEAWSRRLRSETGIDNGFRKCGGLYLARTIGEAASLTGLLSEWRERQIDFEELSLADVRSRFRPYLKTLEASAVAQAVWVPGEAQFSNPSHLQALIAACGAHGVSMHEGIGEAKIASSNGEIDAVMVGTQEFIGDHYVFAAGPWTEKLVEILDVPLPMQPVRGQIALYKIDPIQDSDSQSISLGPIVNDGSRYLVPRQDGHVLAGATIEEVGFDCQVTKNEIADLRDWAENLSVELNESTLVKSWAGLRPGTYDGFPYLGRLGEVPNAYVATGHFKSGLHLSTGTAVVLADLIEGKTVAIDLKPFSPFRAADHQSTDKI